MQTRNPALIHRHGGRLFAVVFRQAAGKQRSARDVVSLAITLLATLILSTAATAAVFTDDFNSGPSSFWENNYGDWTADGGVYSATNPSTSPNAASALPWELTDFTIEFDINNVSDGGVWLRSSETTGSIGRNGVLLVTRSNRIYWHVVTDGSNYGSSLNPVNNLFAGSGGNPHLKVEVSGSTYSVYLDDALTPISVFNNLTFMSGQVALYDFSAQSFDNVVLTGDGVPAVPVPAAFSFFGPALLGLGGLGYRRRRTR